MAIGKRVIGLLCIVVHGQFLFVLDRHCHHLILHAQEVIVIDHNLDLYKDRVKIGHHTGNHQRLLHGENGGSNEAW